MSGALSSIRVIDFGQYIAGPMTAMMLGDQGADVIRIDPPGGSRWQHAANAVLQRGKRSIILDLKHQDDNAIARRLIECADVVIENFRPGVMHRLGLGPEAMLAANPELVYCSLPGFATDDPRALTPAWEGVVSAATAFYSPRRAGNEPIYSAIPLASSYAAIIAANSTVAALIARDRMGKGQHVEVPLFNSMFDAIGRAGIRHTAKSGARAHAASDPDLLCADGKYIRVVLRVHRHTEWLVKLLKPEWTEEGLADARHLIEHPELAIELKSRLAELFKTQPAAYWDNLLNEAGIPCSVVQTSEEWLQDKHARITRQVIEVRDPELGPTTQAGYPVILSKTPAQTSGPRHRLDADRDSILADMERPRPVLANKGEAISRPLEGMRVLDLTQVLAGPTAGRVLAELGAEVIKINDPQAEALIYLHVNSGKRTMLLNIKTEEGREVLWRLAENSNAFLQNFAKGTADRIGIGVEAVSKHRPGIVYSSVSAYGHEGPRGAYRGWEPLGQAPTGMMERYGGDGLPMMARFSVCDYGTGLLSAFAILLGLYYQSRTGEGQHVQSSLSQSGTYLQIPFMIDYKGRTWDEPRGQSAKGWGPLNRFYKASDRWFYLQAPRQGDKARLASVEELSGIDELGGDDLEAALAERFAFQSATTWVKRLNAADIGAHELLSVDEVMEDAWVKSHQLSLDQDHPDIGLVRTPGPGVRLSLTPVQPNFPAPPPGWHTRELLEEVGLSERYGELAAAHIVSEQLPLGTPFE